MLEREEPVVEFKLDVLGKALPGCNSAVLFGDMWRVDGGYSFECAKHCERVLLIDSLETAAWQQGRIEEPKVDFRKGDFSDPLFMASIRERFDLGVVYDILLHQPAMLGTLTLMLGLVEKRFCVVQPMLEEQAHPGTLIYLPGNTSVKDLYPLEAETSDHKLFDVDQVNHSHWIWAMTPSFLTAAIAAEGFDLVSEQTLGPLPNPRWQWWGGVYERTRPQSSGHWSKQQVTPGIFSGEW
jgi:hypothetical protein